MDTPNADDPAQADAYNMFKYVYSASSVEVEHNGDIDEPFSLSLSLALNCRKDRAAYK